MKKILYTTIFCISLFPLVGCAHTESNGNELKTLTKASELKAEVKTEQVKTETQTEKTKTDAERIKTDYPNLKPQADEMGKAFLTNDFDKFADFMYPKLIEMTGGREKFVLSLSSLSKQFESSGLEMISYEVGEPRQTIEIDNQVFAVLPTKTVMKISQREIIDEGSLIAASEDKGGNWKFVRAKTKEAMKTLFPKVVDKLTFSESVIK